MENLVVHRIVEQHAATRGESTALDQDGETLTYRELNVRANGVARHLLDAGFRRGGHMIVSMEHGFDLATVLLAALKVGGCYTWQAPGYPGVPWPVAFASRPDDDVRQYRPVDVGSMLRHPVRTSPNLPVLTRPSDLACVLADSDTARVLVPHSTIAALKTTTASPHVWDGDSSTFDLWVGLMSGTALSIVTAPALLNAA
jgi:acyl-CoA synthetase (AMP-forming)/AMP-acid ligase II